MRELVGGAGIVAIMAMVFAWAMSTTSSAPVRGRDTSDPHWREGLWETGGRGGHLGPWRHLSGLGGAPGAGGVRHKQWLGSPHDPARDAHCLRYPELCQ